MINHSFISLMEQMALVNKNSIEVMSKMSDAISTPKTSVTVNLIDPDGTKSTFQMPTIGYFKQELDVVKANIKKLANLEGNAGTVIIDGQSSKKVYTVDLNVEPATISSVNPVTTFHKNINWFFESLMNPILSISLDLSGRIDDKTTKILCRRYIVNFEKDSQGALTTRGQSSLNDFKSLYLNSTNIAINDFLNWYKNPTNLGVIGNIDSDLYLDEQMFDLNYRTVNYRGIFSVIRQEFDALNNKNWYHLNSLTIVGVDGTSKNLAIGDELIINNKNTMTRYKIIEINTASSLNRVSLETVEGYDPIPIGTNVLKYYSTVSTNKSVNVTIGFDEYNVIFVKPINTENNIIGTEWSTGFAYFTNDLTLDTDRNINLSNYYVSSVFDYGTLLRDMVLKNIPSEFGQIPNKPVLNSSNFKVVQINKHLTDTIDTVHLKKLTAQKNTSKSKISQINDSIVEKNKELNIKVFKSIAEKTKSQNELDKLIKAHESETKLFSSVVVQLKNSIPNITIDPKFRVRGFWDIPDPIQLTGYKNQEVIGFEVQYKYKSKSGQENATESFEMIKPTIGGTTTAQKKLGYFSQWISYKTDIRKRYHDEYSQQWKWKIEDVSDADTPNINQLDISLNIDESVDIRIRSISEVGYPNAPLMSDWTDVITIDFPDELNDAKNKAAAQQAQEAAQEAMLVEFQNELNSKGVTRHVQDSFYVNESYFSHTDKVLATSFKDSYGNTLSLYDYLKQLNDKISVLEEKIKNAKGTLKVTLFKGTEEIVINNNSTYNITVNCDDYNKLSGSTTNWFSRTYYNYIYVIQDYYLKIENTAKANDLGLFSNLTLSEVNPTTQYMSAVVNENDILEIQQNNQFIWIKDKDSDISLYSAVFIDDNDLNNGLNASELNLDNINLGILNSNSTSNLQITDDVNWTDAGLTQPFLASVYPKITKININNTVVNELVNRTDGLTKWLSPGKYVTVPLNLYYKLDGTKFQNATTIIDASQTVLKINKKLKFFLDPENTNRGFTFTLKFTFIRNNISPVTNLASNLPKYTSNQNNN